MPLDGSASEDNAEDFKLKEMERMFELYTVDCTMKKKMTIQIQGSPQPSRSNMHIIII